MSADEFIKKWTFLPPIRYYFSIYSIDAYFLNARITLESNSLENLLIEIDKALEVLQK
jgi:hypothetical protein